MKAKDLIPGQWYVLEDGDEWTFKFVKIRGNQHIVFNKIIKWSWREVESKEDYFQDVNNEYSDADMNFVAEYFPEERSYQIY